MDRGARWATVHGVAKSQAQLSDQTTTTHFGEVTVHIGLNHELGEGDEDDPDCSSVDKSNNPAHPEEMGPHTEKISCDSGCVASLQPQPWADLTKEEVEKREGGGEEAKGKAAEARWKGVREKEPLP